MPLSNPFKLEKLTITAYKDDKRTEKVGDPFKAMFNPESFSEKYSTKLLKKPSLNPASQTVTFGYTPPPVLSLKLLLDGTGSSELGVEALANALTGNSLSVADRIKQFLSIASDINGKLHQPNYLDVTWGKLSFPCRLQSVDINYTLFNPDGTPLRAELNISLLFDQNAKKGQSIAGLSSPDLTHSRIVKDGDTLPLLSKEIYGTSNHYLWIAQQNQLDDFRNLNPGQRLFFPPLV